jgi:hypothetical protein
VKLSDALLEKLLRHLVRGGDRKSHIPCPLNQHGCLTWTFVEGLAIQRMAGSRRFALRSRRRILCLSAYGESKSEEE